MVELDFNNQIGDTLTRFCDEKIFIMADIKYMFHQLMVQKEDKSLSRSLFREKNDIDGSANDFDIGIYLHPNTVWRKYPMITNKDINHIQQLYYKQIFM